MSKSKSKKEKAPSPKKEIRSQITDQLKNALTSLEEKLGKKEFEGRIKKAAKMLSAGIKIKPSKPVNTKAVKKDTAAPEVKTE
jgi:hypothetical protein